MCTCARAVRLLAHVLYVSLGEWLGVFGDITSLLYLLSFAGLDIFRNRFCCCCFRVPFISTSSQHKLWSERERLSKTHIRTAKPREKRELKEKNNGGIFEKFEYGKKKNSYTFLLLLLLLPINETHYSHTIQAIFVISIVNVSNIWLLHIPLRVLSVHTSHTCYGRRHTYAMGYS